MITSTSTTPSSLEERPKGEPPKGPLGCDPAVRRNTSLPAPFSLEKVAPQLKHWPCCPFSVCAGAPYSGHVPEIKLDSKYQEAGAKEEWNERNE